LQLVKTKNQRPYGGRKSASRKSELNVYFNRQNVGQQKQR